MGFLYLSAKNMLRHRVRTVLTLCSILVSVGILFAVISYDRGFSRALEREMSNTGIHITAVPTGCPHEAATLLLQGGVLPRMLGRESIDEITEVLGDRAASFYPMLIAQALNTKSNRLDVLYGLDRESMPYVRPGWSLEQGSFPSTSREVLVGLNTARQYELRPGDKLSYQTRGTFDQEFQDRLFLDKMDEVARMFQAVEGLVQDLVVAGILGRTGTQDDGAVFVPLPAAYMVLGRVDGLTALGIRLKDPGEAGAISRELEGAVSGIQAVTPDHLLDTVSEVVYAARILSFSMVILVAVISTSGVMNSILMTVYERTREIGTMRALGASRLDIFRLTMSEAYLLTFIGGVLGIVLVLASAPVIEESVRSFLPYAPEGLTLSFDPLVAVACLFFSMLIGILAGLYPAWKSSGISPVEAMRN